MGAASLDYVDTAEGIRHICLNGRLDMTGIEEVNEPFAALAQGEHLRILVDLQGVSYLASIGIRAVINLARQLHQNGGRMSLLLGDNQQVQATLELTGITAAIPSFRTLTEAVSALTTA